MARLFIAVWPSPDVVDVIASLARPDVAGLRWTNPGQWHVTLRFLGRVDDVTGVVDTLGMLAAEPVEAAVGPATGRFGQRVLHVPVDGLGDVAAAVVGATAALGEPPEDRGFAGHLTLARVAKGARVDLRRLAGVPVTGRWWADEVTLVESRLSSAGPGYEVVERFPLRRAASSA